MIVSVSSTYPFTHLLYISGSNARERFPGPHGGITHTQYTRIPFKQPNQNSTDQQTNNYSLITIIPSNK